MRRQYSKIRGITFLRLCAIGLAPLGFLAACSDKSADRDKDGEISQDERNIAAGISKLTPMKPGLWQVDVKFVSAQMAGLSERKKQEILTRMSNVASSRQCLSKAEAQSPPEAFYIRQQAGECRYRSFDVDGRKVAIGISCGRGNMATFDTDLTGNSTESNFDFAANSDLRLPMIGKIMLQGTAKGRYVGACPGV